MVSSFVNYSFIIGEWLIKQDALDTEMIESLEGEVLIGIPSLAVLHCIEKTNNFAGIDENIHFANGHSIDPINNNLPIDIKRMLLMILKGSQIYKEIEFNYETYDEFRLNIIKSHAFDSNIQFHDKQKELYQLIYKIALPITQIKEYKEKYMNVLEFLNIIVKNKGCKTSKNTIS